jgi:hypothetical protein
MGHPKALALALCVLVLGGCASGVVGSMRKSFRAPGEKLETLPDAVWREYACATHSLPLFRLERNELLPERVEAGNDVNHRMVYVLCPSEPTAVIHGALQTRILFRGRPIVRETDADYEIKPGRWVVDTFIQIPPQAETGIYSVEVSFESGGVRFRDELSFAVESASR